MIDGDPRDLFLHNQLDLVARQRRKYGWGVIGEIRLRLNRLSLLEQQGEIAKIRESFNSALLTTQGSNSLEAKIIGGIGYGSMFRFTHARPHRLSDIEIIPICNNKVTYWGEDLLGPIRILLQEKSDRPIYLFHTEAYSLDDPFVIRVMRGEVRAIGKEIELMSPYEDVVRRARTMH